MGGMGLFVGAFILIVLLAVVGISGSILYHYVTMGRQRRVQTMAPVVEAQARVVDKRVDSIGRRKATPEILASPSLNRVGTGDADLYQVHRVTFEQSGGERFELNVPASEYGLIVEGDTGVVTMKGSELLAFNREIMR